MVLVKRCWALLAQHVVETERWKNSLDLGNERTGISIVVPNVSGPTPPTLAFMKKELEEGLEDKQMCPTETIHCTGTTLRYI